MKKLSWGTIASITIFLYITVGAGYEIVRGIQRSQVSATLPFILLSCMIFVCRIGYAFETKATKTVWADIYGGVVMLILLSMKLFYAST